ncbi:hypothetical protein [Micromonospora okii]|uniref:hypothetical protein n=1 Tax=Micromonospora okii TaxID=1182970 RepID=UPI001E6439F6|nr:hypothetical protein [Micromonospora okii]
MTIQPTRPDPTRYDGLRLHRCLERHGVRTRYRELAPAPVWLAVADHVVSPDVALAMAERARSRMLFAYAELLYERAAHSGRPAADEARLRLWVAQGGSRTSRCWPGAVT